jgi:ABC-type Fe3+ transport system substrate-binding protein
MLRRILIATVPLAIIVALPLAMRRDTVQDDPHAEQLVIVSPHNEAIRWEFENAFQKYCRETYNRNVDIDWRTPGGTSEIVRYLRGGYVAAFRQEWERQGKRWSAQVEAACLNRKLKKDDASPEAWEARQAFLASSVGVGIDILYGGGQYDLGNLAKEGVLVPSGVRQRHPEWFTGKEPILSDGLSGEIWADPEDRYYGACLSSFGICYNLDRLAALDYDIKDPAALPDSWEDLADPRLFGQVGVADPSKSGSITKCFEMLIQQRMAQTVAAAGPNLSREQKLAALSQGWVDAMGLIRRIGGNARYFTFSASKVPVDVARGNLAAGMCIDFYGGTQAEWEQQHVGHQTMRYVTPAGGSSISADPIGILRGAPHRELAELFIDFVLSREGQRLWNYRVGEPGGPEQYALRRPPIRRDMYSAEDRSHMSDPDAQPFALAQEFDYHGGWTGPLFGLIRVQLRAMVIDTHPELRRAWRAILDAGGPQAVPDAMAALRTLPFGFAEARDEAKHIRMPEERVFRMRAWSEFFRASYLEAEQLAKRHAR